jgi:K+-transporting ATPase ATPase C chain
MSSGASNLGPENVVDAPNSPSLLTQVCQRSKAAGDLNGVDGSRPFCTNNGVGAVLSVIGPRDPRGNVTAPTQVVSINEPCDTTQRPFLASYEGVPVTCAKPGEDYSAGMIVPIRGAAPADPAVPADAVTSSGSGLDPDISVGYADLQIARVAKARGVSADQVRSLVAKNTDGRDLGFFGEPRVNVVELNVALDQKFPLKS